MKTIYGALSQLFLFMRLGGTKRWEEGEVLKSSYRRESLKVGTKVYVES